MTRRHRLLATAVACVLTPLAAIAATPSSTAVAPAPVAETSPVRIAAPARIETTTRGEKARVHLRARLIAGAEPFDIWARRASYSTPIRAVWRSDAGDVPLPDDAMRTFNELQGFVGIRVKNLRTGKSSAMTRSACLNSYSTQRTRPDAPARSPYPTYCFSNPYSLGTVMGVQAGWAAPLDAARLRLPRGRYDVTVALAARYRRALGIDVADAVRTIRVVVTRGADPEPVKRAGRRPSATARPGSTSAPPGAEARATGPLPNLRSLPAFGIGADGDVLRFGANVWNGGSSPLVVDGFRDDNSTTMDAYQYFFDGDGNQVGYQRAGRFIYHDHSSHQHWHFTGFARYRLLNANKQVAVRSTKRSFCLANTDAVDLTVPDAEWRPENTDLHTACGDEETLAMRQVLSNGWGDTYYQGRAGQAFKLAGLPNGRYYIEVTANPGRSLVESNYADNVQLRRIYIGGRPGNRTVRVPQVGDINENWGRAVELIQPAASH